ncbi:MAG: leucine-rich repeat protein [Bacteroidaceae bacterium]|nr:leucine-rich repeat protein [Bacteroidaceae bacterium]
MYRKLTICMLLLAAAISSATAGNVRRWDFTKWSETTIANLKADAAGWSDIEKVADTEPTQLSAGNCYWEVTAMGTTDGVTLTANGQPIAELEGLLYTNTRSRSLAIAVNYGDLTSTGTDFAPYHGPSYLWLGGKEQNYLVIPNVAAGAKIRIGVESHKVTNSRGVQLFLGHGNTGTELMDAEGNPVPTVTAYTDQEWVVPTDAADAANADGTYDVQIRNTNGCHIYYIEVDDASSWIFTNGVSQETIANLQADDTWEVTLNDDGTFNRAQETVRHTGPFYANGVEIAELEGLALGLSGLGISNNAILFSNKFRINRDKMQLYLPQLMAGQTITVRARSANKDATDRGLRIDNNYVTVVKQPKDGLVPGINVASDDREEDGNFTFVWCVTSNVTEPTDIPIIAITGGVDIASIAINRSLGTAPAPVCFKAEVNGRRMFFRIIDKEAKTVETYPCEEFKYGKAIELFDNETEHYFTGDGNFTIPATVVNPNDGETYSVVGIGDESFTCLWWHGTTIEISEGVNYIGKRALYNNNFEKIILPSTITSIADDAFGKSWGLTVMKVGMATPVKKAVGTNGLKYITDATLLVPEGTREAYAEAEYWKEFGQIEEYRPTGTVFTAQTEQGIDMQFRVLDENTMTVETYAVPYDVDPTDWRPAISKKTEGELIVPAEIEGYRVVGIGGWSFRECQKLTTVTLPVGISYIGHSAFRMDINLASVNIPEGVDSIGELAFWNNVIPTFTLPSTLRTIGDRAFRSSTAKNNGEELDIPCIFTTYATVPPTCNGNAIYFQSNYDLYVPEGCKEAYKANDGWSGFRNIREIGEVDEEVEDMVTATDITVTAGETATTTVSLTTGDTDYNGYQLVLYLPEGISIAINEESERTLVKEKTGRTKLDIECGDGGYLLGGYTMDTEMDALVSGPLMEVTLKADEGLPAGEYTVRVEKVILATRGSLENLPQSVTLPASSFTVTVEKAAEPEVPAIVEAEDVQTEPAGQVKMPIFLNNQQDISAFYFDLTLPMGVTVAEDTDGNFVAELVGDYAGGKMLLMAQKWNTSMGTTTNTNTWRFIATPLDENAVVKANAGYMMNITLAIDKNLAGGVYTARLNVVKLVATRDEADGSRILRVMRAPETEAAKSSFAKITVVAKKPGDVNGDYSVDVADIASVISRMSGDTSVTEKAADVNRDGVVDVADIATIIDTMAANARRQRK